MLLVAGAKYTLSSKLGIHVNLVFAFEKHRFSLRVTFDVEPGGQGTGAW